MCRIPEMLTAPSMIYANDDPETSAATSRTREDRGRNRVEQYDTNDASLMRRHGDVIVAGLLREAIKADDFLLHAQPIVSLADTSLV
jgi:hypothetical protein